MPTVDRDWLLSHLDEQARYLAALTAWARANPTDSDVLLRVRDEAFTLRETLNTLEVPHALASNQAWRVVPHAAQQAQWPRADDAGA